MQGLIVASQRWLYVEEYRATFRETFLFQPSTLFPKKKKTHLVWREDSPAAPCAQRFSHCVSSVQWVAERQSSSLLTDWLRKKIRNILCHLWLSLMLQLNISKVTAQSLSFICVCVCVVIFDIAEENQDLKQCRGAAWKWTCYPHGLCFSHVSMLVLLSDNRSRRT